MTVVQCGGVGHSLAASYSNSLHSLPMTCPKPGGRRLFTVLGQTEVQSFRFPEHPWMRQDWLSLRKVRPEWLHWQSLFPRTLLHRSSSHLSASPSATGRLHFRVSIFRRTYGALTTIVLFFTRSQVPLLLNGPHSLIYQITLQTSPPLSLSSAVCRATTLLDK